MSTAGRCRRRGSAWPSRRRRRTGARARTGRRSSPRYAGLNENARPCCQMNAPGNVGTSETGREIPVDPEALQIGARRAPFPVRHGRAAVCARSAAARGRAGRSESRLTWPPSWSVAISSGGLRPWRAARCSEPVSARSCVPADDVGGEQDHRADLPVADGRSSPNQREVPDRPTMIRWPSSLRRAGT